jgi:ABC-type dipeptide/oligopeptide/nickel transport system ATPase component
MNALLSTDVSVDYRTKPRVLRRLQLELEAGEIVGLAGQSGSGKSTFALTILGLLDRKNAQVTGRVDFAGKNLISCNESDLREVRGREISLVPQSPLASLNPCLRLATQFKEAWCAHMPKSKARWREESLTALNAASLPAEEDFLRRHPRELSVGMAQRVLIALAVLHRPKLLIADEATSALDLITQSEILALFKQLSRANGISILFITHDLAAAASVCDRLAIMYEGEIAESGTPDQILRHPEHPYTARLVAALPNTSGAGSRPARGLQPSF